MALPLPSWLKPANPAEYAAEGMRIADSEQSRMASERAQSEQSARQDQELQMRQKQLEGQAQQAALKYQAQQGYQQAIASGVDPIQAILKFGPAMGASGDVGAAIRTRAAMAPKPPPTIQMQQGPDGTMIPLLTAQGHTSVIPRSAYAQPQPPEQFTPSVRQIEGEDVPGQESSKTHRFVPYPARKPVVPPEQWSDATDAQGHLGQRSSKSGLFRYAPVSDQPGAVTQQERMAATTKKQEIDRQGKLLAKTKTDLQKQIDDTILMDKTFSQKFGHRPTTEERNAYSKQLEQQVDDIDGKLEDLAGGKLPSDGKPNGVPKAGDVIKGYTFKGGDPSDKANWTKADSTDGEE